MRELGEQNKQKPSFLSLFYDFISLSLFLSLPLLFSSHLVDSPPYSQRRKKTHQPFEKKKDRKPWFSHLFQSI